MTREELDEQIDRAVGGFSQLEGIDEALALKLVEEGYMSYDDLSIIEPDDLAAMGDLTEEVVERIVEQAEERALEAEAIEAEQRRRQREQDRIEKATAEAQKLEAQRAEAQKAEAGPESAAADASAANNAADDANADGSAADSSAADGSAVNGEPAPLPAAEGEAPAAT